MVERPLFVTEISRRRVLSLGFLTAGAAVLAGPLSQLAPTAAAAATKASAPTLEQWQALIGSSVVVTTTEGHRASLLLRSATALEKDSLLKGHGYVLIFRGARHPVLPTRQAVLSHPSIGRFRALLLPVSKPSAHQSYQLIVDRRRPVGSSWR